MEKMRWFVIGNLVGLSLLILGIAAREYWRTSTFAFGGAAKSSTVQTAKKTGSGATVPESKAAPVSATDNEESSDTAATVPSVRILAASRDIAKGTKLIAGDVILRDVSPKHALAKALTSEREALGKTTKVDLVEGELIRLEDLTNL